MENKNLAPHEPVVREEGPSPSNATAEPAAERYRMALRKILFLRPGGPCTNRLIVEMENIALDALEHGDT